MLSAAVARHNGAVFKKLPPAIRDLAPSEKLAWLYIRAHPGQHSVRSLETALGGRFPKVLRTLVAAGLLVEESPPRGVIPGTYRAVTPE